ncbi:MAG: CocE/NonD family hydrolase [Verrucomicrobiales bacterium]|nr:CocE/NonD family hydrolase [Verrucomicrobiales bacterium]
MHSRLIAGLLAVTGSLAAAEKDAASGVLHDVMVPMRDGTRLATDIAFPIENGQPVEGRFPVILSRTPYGKSVRAAKDYTTQGYVVVSQDTRGRGKSEGVWTWMKDDVADGYDCIEWIAQQPWSNGKIGMIGCSYVGATQHLAAMARPPHLTTIMPSSPSINHGIGSVLWGGAFRLRIVNWMLGNAAKGSTQAREPTMREFLSQQSDQREYYLRNLPLRRGLTPLRAVPEYEEMLISMLEHRRNDGFWDFSNIIDRVDQHQDLPVCMIGGWYDLFSASTTQTYRALKHQLTAPVHLIMGPWAHCGFGQSHGQVDFGPDAALSSTRFQRAWMDRWLKDDASTWGDVEPFQSPVRLFVMGTGDGHKTEDGKLFHGGFWRNETDYPLQRAVATSYYLLPGGSLSLAPTESHASTTSFEFDPKNPVPTVGGCTVGTISGAWNQWGGPHIWNAPEPMPLSMRNDIVVFTTPPLEQDIEVVGPVTVKLWASSSSVDTDFTAKLIDAYPPSADFPGGFDLIMGDGIIRARQRESATEEHLLEPGEICEFTLQLDPCCNRFKKGHRIRVDISSSNFPRFDVNPNSGEPANDFRRSITAVNTLHHDREHPSRIILPVVPIASPP